MDLASIDIILSKKRKTKVLIRLRNKGADQNARMCRLICTFVVGIWHKTSCTCNILYLGYLSSLLSWLSSVTTAVVVVSPSVFSPASSLSSVLDGETSTPPTAQLVCERQIKSFEPQHDKFNKMACAPSTDSDQPGHPPSLIRVFAVHRKKAWALSYPLSAQLRLWADCQV